jgi:hypothetical protein
MREIKDMEMTCTSITSDLKLGNISKRPTCPNYNHEFVKFMGNQSSYWKIRNDLKPFNLKDKEFYLSELVFSDAMIKSKCDTPRETYKQLENELLRQAEDSLLEYFKLESPGVPDDVIRAFIRGYVGFEMNMTRDIKTRENVVRVTPTWRPVKLIDFDSEDVKIVSDFFLKE